MLDHVETPLPTCYCTRLGQSYVELHGCRWGSQKFGDTGVPPLVVGHRWHPRNALSRMCYSAEFGCYSSSHMGIGRCLKKILCTLWPCPIGIGHGCPCRNMHLFSTLGFSRSLEVIRTDTDRSATYVFLIVLLLLSAVTHAPFHAPVLRPTSWPNARDRRDGEVN